MQPCIQFDVLKLERKGREKKRKEEKKGKGKDIWERQTIIGCAISDHILRKSMCSGAEHVHQ